MRYIIRTSDGSTFQGFSDHVDLHALFQYPAVEGFGLGLRDRIYVINTKQIVWITKDPVPES